MKIIPSGPGDWEQRYAKALAGAGWTCHEPGKSCIGTEHSYQGKRQTSYGASVYVLPRTGTQRERILRHLQIHGPMTDEEMQIQLRISGNSQRPRREELEEGGFVRDSGRVKKLHGTEHIIWEVCPGVPSEVG